MGCKGRGGGVCALNLIYVGWIEWSSKGTEGKQSGVRRREGVGMKGENVWRGAMLGVDEGFALGVAICGNLVFGDERQ